MRLARFVFESLCGIIEIVGWSSSRVLVCSCSLCWRSGDVHAWDAGINERRFHTEGQSTCRLTRTRVAAGACALSRT